MDFALMFLGDKSDIHLDLTKYNVAAMNALLKFEIPAAWNCKLVTANCKLQFPVAHEKPDTRGL